MILDCAQLTLRNGVAEHVYLVPDGNIRAVHHKLIVFEHRCTAVHPLKSFKFLRDRLNNIVLQRKTLQGKDKPLVFLIGEVGCFHLVGVDYAPTAAASLLRLDGYAALA